MLGGAGKSHCSIRGHKKGINLNLVYNAMPFKLILLACALKSPGPPSIPHSVCSHSLCAGGVNVNSAAAWAERILRGTESQQENEENNNNNNNNNKKQPAIEERFVFSLILKVDLTY